MQKYNKIPHQKNQIQAHTQKKTAWVIVILTGVLLFLCINLVSAGWTANLNTGLRHYFNFDETSGTVLPNLVNATHHNGTLFNMTDADWVNGILSKGLDFDAVDDIVNLSYVWDGNRNMTISVWFNTSGSSDDFIFGHDDGATNEWRIRMNGPGSLRFSVRGTGGENLLDTTIINLDDGQWHHAVMVWNNGTHNMSAYVDGVIDSSIDTNDPNCQLTMDLGVGARRLATGWDGWFWGVIDEIGIWNRTLTAAEITALYNGGAGITYPIGGGGASSVTVVLDIPLNETSLSTTGTNFTANYTSLGGADLKNYTYYIWNSTGIFNDTEFGTMNGTSNTSNMYIDDFVLETYTWNVYACGENTTDTVCAWASSNYTFSVGATTNNEFYYNYVYETSKQDFSANITLLSGATLYDTKLYYNETSYTAQSSSIGTNLYNLTSSIDIPKINVSINLSFFWGLTFEKPDKSFVYQNLSANEQTVRGINLSLCRGTFLINRTLNFTSYYEANETSVKRYDFYGTFVYWLGSGGVRKNISMARTNITNVTLCIKPNNLTYYSDAKIQYEKAKHIKRSYYLINSSLTNTTNDIGLYLLNSTLSTSFIINIIDNVQFPIVNAYIYIQRYYPGSGTFHTVEMARTDDSGNTVGHFEAETEDYKIIVFKEGVILYESDMQKVFCGETPCTLSFQIQAAAPTIWTNIGDLVNLIWSLTYNEITKFWTYTYVDTSGTTNFGRLLVYTEGGTDRTIICNNTDTSSAATLTCNVTGYDGTIYAEAYIKRSPEILVWLESIVERAVKAIFGMEGLFWATMIILLIGLIGVWNPSVGIIMMVGGIVMINFLQIASLGTVTIMGIAVIGMILLWEMKKP